jgi:cytochrome c553
MRSRTAIGLAFAALAAPAAGAGLARAEGDKALGEYLSSECVTCHQLTGRYEGIPPIVGWPDATFIAIMDEYRSKKRSNPIMQTIAGRLSAEEVASLAAYFGSLAHQPAK